MAPMGEAGSVGGVKLGEVGPSRRESADYISEIVPQLSEMARSSGLPLLSYMLDIAGSQARTDAREAADADRKTGRVGKASS